MVNFNNLSSFFEFSAGLLGAFVGLKSFREEIYTSNASNIKYLNSVKENTVKEREELNLYALENTFLKNSLSNLKIHTTKLTKLTEDGLEILTFLKFPLKVSYIFSFIYCGFMLLFIGIQEYIKSLNLQLNLLIFFNNVLLLNTLIFFIVLIKNKTAYVFNFYQYLVCLIFLYFVSKLILYSLDTTYSNTSLLTISIIVPFSPFIFQILLEMYINIRVIIPIYFYYQRVKKLNRNLIEMIKKT